MWVWIVALYEPRGEFDSSESRQYTTPVWFTWMLGVHPIPTAKPNASSNSNRRKQYWIKYKVLLPLLEKLKHFWTALSHFTFSWKHGSKWKFRLAWYRCFFLNKPTYNCDIQRYDNTYDKNLSLCPQNRYFQSITSQEVSHHSTHVRKILTFTCKEI